MKNYYRTRIFFEKFCSFWKLGDRQSLENLTQWWEVGKAQIKVFRQQFSYNTTSTVKRNMKNKEIEINEMGKRIIDVDDEEGSVNI